MKKILVSAILAGGAISAASAQGAVDAYTLSPTDLRGTARYMSMAGAFTALGGDLSTLSQNPAGIGVYRKSEVGITVDFNMTHSNVSTNVADFKDNKTHVYCNNFGYIGAINLGDNSTLRTFNWGASYNRIASFDRTFHIGEGSGQNYLGPSINTSLSNYIASFTNDPTGVLNAYQDGYNPYVDSDADWLSILAYNSYMINPSNDGGYNGLWRNGQSTGDMGAWVRERGHIDEYNIDFGGNILDCVYWGLGFGITDLTYTQEADYDEKIYNGRVPNAEATSVVVGDSYFNLMNNKHVSGTGYNFKVGVIIKPINEIRIGLAVHTPTYYSLSQRFDASTNFDYSTGYDDMYEDTNLGYFVWKLRSPWRMMVGVAGVIGGRGIISLDYERDAYDALHISDRGVRYNYDPENQDIKNYFQGSNTIRIGAEYRVTPSFSVRDGYSYVTSAVKSDAENGALEIYTSGTNPAFVFDQDTQYITFGAGYRYKAFYADAAYVYKNRKSTYHAFTDYEGVQAPKFGLTDINNNIVLSVGLKF